MTRKSEILAGKKVLFLSSTEFGHRTREFREAMSLHNAGADVMVYGYSAKTPELWAESPIKTDVYVPETRGVIASENPIWAIRVFMNLTVNIVRRAIRNFSARKIEMNNFRKRGVGFHPDIVHAMDLPSLADAARIAKKAHAKLVYDSSEYWIGFMKNEFWRSYGGLSYDYVKDEKRYINQTDLILTTSPTMSRKLYEDYGTHNFSCLYNSPVLGEKRYEASFSEGPDLKLVFHGGVGPDRNLEGLFEAMAMLPSNVKLDVYGSIYPGYEERCKKAILKLELENRVVFHGKYNYGEMLTFLREYDIGVYPAMAEDGKFDVTLPNKVFDCICAGLALIVPDFISMKELMDEARCGLCVNTEKPPSIADSIMKLLNDKALLNGFKKRSSEISEKYSWEAQEEVLLQAYERLF